MLRMLFCWGAHAPTECRENEIRKYPLRLVQKCLIADVVQLLREQGCTFEHEFGLKDPEMDSGSLHLRWMQFRQYPDDLHRSGNRRLLSTVNSSQFVDDSPKHMANFSKSFGLGE